MAIYCFVVLSVVFVFKFRQLRARWGSPGVGALCGTVFFATVTLWVAVRENMVRVDHATGVPNIWVLLHYSFSTAAVASAISLALFWRYPPPAAWRRVRWVIAGYAAIIIVRVPLFAASSVPRQRLAIDFLLTYLTQPTVAAFLLSFSVPGALGMGGLAYCCFAWAREDDYANHPWLRRGLRLYAAAALSFGLYCLEEAGVVITKFFGNDVLDPVSRIVPYCTSVAYTTFLAGALVVPVLGPRLVALRMWLGRWRVFLRLRALHQALRHVAPGAVLVASGKRLDPHHRVRRMVIELSDWHWILAPLFDPAVTEAAERLGREAGFGGEPLDAAVEAAQLKAASHAWRQGQRTASATAADRRNAQEDDPQDGTDIHTELAWWLQVARAFDRSPVVAGALAQAGTSTVASTGAEPS